MGSDLPKVIKYYGRVGLAPECPDSQHDVLSTIFFCSFECEAERKKNVSLSQTGFATWDFCRSPYI